jgi:hypothetical protein
MPSPLTDSSSEPVYEAEGDASSQFGTLVDRPSFRRKPSHPHMNSGSHSLYPLNHQPGNTSLSSGTAEFSKQLEPSNIEPVIGASPSEAVVEKDHGAEGSQLYSDVKYTTVKLRLLRK